MYQIEKIDMRVKYTREWCFEALNKLLDTKSYENIKISEIISKAGISRATFYRNFKTKDDVIRIKVRMFFESFHKDIYDYYKKNEIDDEIFLIQSFFKKIDEEGKLIDTVIKSKLEYLMVSGILEIINHRRDQFYSIVKINKKAEDYTMDIVASSVWTLLSRWHRSGKEESPRELANIYSSAFRSVYIALFGDKSDLR